jgi:FdhD protein
VTNVPPFEEVRPGLTTSARVLSWKEGSSLEHVDELATEEPLEIRLMDGAHTRSIAVTMRTPGNDFELACGFLLSEGIIRNRSEVTGISYCVDPSVDAQQRYNIINVELAPGHDRPIERLERHFTMSSACGVCGKATIEALQTRARRIEDPLRVGLEFITALPHKMRQAQRVFASTGGLHASALFDANANLLALREDIGRHNALDKICGWALMSDRVPLNGCILLVSGRASYELVQKSIVAGIPIVCAVSAPSSLAVNLASAFGVTLLGFVRDGRANIYAGQERISKPVQAQE